MNAWSSCEIYGNLFLKKMLALHREIAVTNVNVLRYLTACSLQPIEKTKHCTHQPNSSETISCCSTVSWKHGSLGSVEMLLVFETVIWGFLFFLFFFLPFCVFPSKKINQHYARRCTRSHIYNNINFTTKCIKVHSSFFSS